MNITFNDTSTLRSVLEIPSETDESAPAGGVETIASVNGRKVFESSSHEFPVTPRPATTTNSDVVSLGRRNVSGRAGVAIGALAFSSFFMTALSAPTTRTTPTTLAASAPTFSSALSNTASSALPTVSQNQEIVNLRKDINELYSRSLDIDPLAAVALVFALLALIIIIVDKFYKR